MTPLTDPEFNRAPERAVQRADRGAHARDAAGATSRRCCAPAMREDEWLLYLHGAVLGFGAGLVHLASSRPTDNGLFLTG